MPEGTYCYSYIFSYTRQYVRWACPGYSQRKSNGNGWKKKKKTHADEINNVNISSTV